nr:MAG TPA: hypothetical protein [Caudoviricetes sp.]
MYIISRLPRFVNPFDGIFRKNFSVCALTNHASWDTMMVHRR